jgi:hypothetical protein
MSDEPIRIVIPEAHYTLFNTTRSGLPEIVSVNDSLRAFDHTDIFPWHLEVSIEATDLAENGMPTSIESALLYEIGDRIEEAIVGYNALFLARSTWNGKRELAFRVHNPKVTNDILQSLLAEKPPIREWEFVMRSDPSWSSAECYFKLFHLAGAPDA